MTDFREFFEGMLYIYGEHTLRVVEIHYVRKGWVRVLLTSDGERVHTHRTCECEDGPDGVTVLAVDLVTEHEWDCCPRCRGTVA